MAQPQTYRGNLTAAEFPFLSELMGRTVIIPGPDQNYSRQLNSPRNKDRDIGVPQAYYMHNVVPTEAGLTSVSYQNLLSAPMDTDSTFTDMFLVRDTAENSALFAITSSGRCYACASIGAGWVRTTDKAPAAGRFVTVAHVNGQTYIYFGGVGCFKYNFATNALDAQTLTGLTPANIMGVCASNGYMIAWTDTTVLWSSTVDPTDFTPSLTTGAGGGGVQSVKGAITACLPQNNGFIVYARRNAVAEIYTGNAQYPFTAKEIIGAGGLSDPSLSSFDGNSTDHYTYTTAGLQQINTSNSQIAFPAMTDFIAGSQFEDFNEANNTFTTVQLSSLMKKKITLVANRYLVVSYGVTQLTHALVYDFALARWGKLKVTHVDCFEYFYPSTAVVETPRRCIGFLQADGTVQIGIISYDITGSYGVIICGKYQLDRNRYLDMQEIHLESLRSNSIIGIKLLTTVDGLNYSVSTPVLAISTSTYKRFNCKGSGLNHSIVLSGAFHLNSLELKFADGGEVR